MDSILIYQAANDLVQNTGTRNIKRIARSCSLDILETPRFKDVLGFLSLHFDKNHKTSPLPRCCLSNPPISLRNNSKEYCPRTILPKSKRYIREKIKAGIRILLILLNKKSLNLCI